LAEPFEALLLLLAEGRIDETEARAAIDAAERGLVTDERMLDAAFAGDDALARIVPTFELEIHAVDTVITCTPQSVTHLLRRTIEQPDTLGISGTTAAAISRAAGQKMQSTPVDYSFACAEAYWLETLGDREAAKHTWTSFERMDDGEWTPHETDTLFLEPRIGVAESTEGTEQLAAIVDQGRREDRPEIAYYGLRNVALAYATCGRLEEAQASFEEAVRLAPELIAPAAMLVLVGDVLQVAAAAADSPAVGAAVEQLGELAQRTPPYVGAAAILARTARLLYGVSEPQAAFRCVARIAECLR
jgi:hypothetical protein